MPMRDGIIHILRWEGEPRGPTIGVDRVIDFPSISVSGTRAQNNTIYEATIISDLRIDIVDTVPIAGKYSQDTPREFKITRIEHIFDGNLETRLEGY